LSVIPCTRGGTCRCGTCGEWGFGIPAVSAGTCGEKDMGIPAVSAGTYGSYAEKGIVGTRRMCVS